MRENGVNTCLWRRRQVSRREKELERDNFPWRVEVGSPLRLKSRTVSGGGGGGGGGLENWSRLCRRRVLARKKRRDSKIALTFDSPKCPPPLRIFAGTPNRCQQFSPLPWAVADLRAKKAHHSWVTITAAEGR